MESAVSLFKSLLKVICSVYCEHGLCFLFPPSQIFDCVLLPTHASSHVQFLLFKVTSYHKVSTR